MTIFDHMTTAEYRAYLQSHESGQHEPSEKIGELPSSHFGRMSAAEYQGQAKHGHRRAVARRRIEERRA